MTRLGWIGGGGPLGCLAATALLAIPCPAAAETVADWRPFAVEASQRFGVPVPWIEHVMQAESAGWTTLGGMPIVSPKGAMGLMQLMPATWSDMRMLLRLGSDPFDPHDNILAGTLCLRLLYDRFGYPGLFAAYNAGPARYRAWLSGSRGLPDETRTYLATVVGPRRKTRTAAQAPRTNRLFVQRAAIATIHAPARTEARDALLFAIPPGR